jgi:hypothetical protein
MPAALVPSFFNARLRSTLEEELSMIRHELAQWPLVVSVSAGLQTVQSLDAFAQDWSRWLDRGEPFAILRVFADADSLVHPEGGARNAKRWLQERGKDIRRGMLGMASVVPADQYEKMRSMNIEKLLGVPARIFANTDDALAWLGEEVMAPRGLRLDALAVHAAIGTAHAAAVVP